MKERGQSKDSDGHGCQGSSGVGGRGMGTDGRTIRDSMEYYRLWIFSSNAVLGVTSAIFIVFGAFVMADARLSLLRDVELYHPTFLYAYTALLIQCGLIQVIGCLGAKNLNEKLLSLYWASLLLLTLGDITVGVFWVFKLDSIKTNLKGRLGEDFLNKYSIDPHFTEVWNLVQAEEHCCGVNGPQDFNRFLSSVQVKTRSNEEESDGTILSLPDSCCTIRIQHISSSHQSRKKRATKAEMSNQRKKRNRVDLLSSEQPTRHLVRHNEFPPHYNFSSSELTSTSPERISGEDGAEIGQVPVPFLCRHLPKHGYLSEMLGMTSEPQHLPLQQPIKPPGNTILQDQGESDLESEERRHRVRHVDGSKPPGHHNAHVSFRARNKVRVYRNGCAHKMYEWVEWVSGVLFILGFCILGFSKFCFLIILRREIKEMIEKIQILKKEVTGQSQAPPPPVLHNSKPRPSIHKQYSTQSGAMSTVSGMSLAGITIKSPHGESHSHYFSTLTHPVNHNPSGVNHDHFGHYDLHHAHHDHYHHETYRPAVGGRRHSARSLGTDSVFQVHRKSQSQSQETVHLSLLISNHQQNGAQQIEEAGQGEESISFKVPTPEEREGKRANWANGSPWELNVSGDSSVSGGPCGYDPASPPGTIYSQSSNSPAPIGRQELVEVDLEKGPLSTGSSLEEAVPTPAPSPDRNRNVERVPERVEMIPEAVPLLEGIPTTPSPPNFSPINSNGNNNLDKMDFDLDSDFVMALIGTPV